MTAFKAGIIGCGRHPGTPGATGSGMGHHHALGYQASPDVHLAALADINLESARLFQDEHGGGRLYADYREMLAKEALDILSICTWPHLHAEMVMAAAEAGVKAIHCEKPMAPTWNEAQRMLAACDQHGVQLTFNHQRRFDTEYRQARQLLRSGAIGKLLRMEAFCNDLFDWGTHWFDMLFFYNDENPVEWVIGQIDPRDGRTVFGIRLEGQGISHFKYQNGVTGLLLTGHSDPWEAYNRLIGEEGIIELSMTRKPPLRIWGKGMPAWQPVPTEPAVAVTQGILDMIDALKSGRQPELSGAKALRATEMIFATYESSRQARRIDLPLQSQLFPAPTIIGSAPS